jgi:hypothetical protein
MVCHLKAAHFEGRQSCVARIMHHASRFLPAGPAHARRRPSGSVSVNFAVPIKGDPNGQILGSCMLTARECRRIISGGSTWRPQEEMHLRQKVGMIPPRI